MRTWHTVCKNIALLQCARTRWEYRQERKSAERPSSSAYGRGWFPFLTGFRLIHFIMSPLRSRVIGNGPDLALIHGWGLGSAVWEPVAEALATRCRLHLVDLPGYAGSASDSAASFDDLARRVLATLPSGVTICGWSLGSMLAQRAARLAPGQVGALALVAATPCFTQRSDWSAGQAPAVLDGFGAALAGNPQATLQRFIALFNQGDTHARTIGRALLASQSADTFPDIDTLVQGLSFLRDVDLRDEISSIHIPALLIHGECDRLMPPGAAQWLANALPHARLEVFPGVAHAPFLGASERFVELVTDFCHARDR